MSSIRSEQALLVPVVSAVLVSNRISMGAKESNFMVARACWAQTQQSPMMLTCAISVRNSDWASTEQIRENTCIQDSSRADKAFGYATCVRAGNDICIKVSTYE